MLVPLRSITLSDPQIQLCALRVPSTILKSMCIRRMVFRSVSIWIRQLLEMQRSVPKSVFRVRTPSSHMQLCFLLLAQHCPTTSLRPRRVLVVQ